jgi:hypothetical protein
MGRLCVRWGWEWDSEGMDLLLKYCCTERSICMFPGEAASNMDVPKMAVVNGDAYCLH